MRSAFVALVVVLVVAAFAGCSTNPATGRKQLLLASPAQVSAMGDAAMPELVAEYGGEIPVTQLRSYVSSVGSALAGRTEPEYAQTSWTFTVLDSDVINAFALPGGYVFISRGLLEHFDNEGQLAGVLGHEIGHLTARHVDEQISHTLVAQGLIAAVSEATESELAVFGAAMFANGYMLKFGRDQESEADEQGVKYMVAAGYDPVAMLQVLDILDAATAGPRPPEFLSTHPHPETRKRTVRALLEGDYRYTQGNSAYGTFPERFRRDAAPYLSGVAGKPAPAGYCLVCAAHR
jgi:predicted Zn-dependent protease